MTEAHNDLPPSKLAQAIRCRIAERIGTRSHKVEVETMGERVVIRGRVTSYYLKQLVLQAALDFVDATRLELNVQVNRLATFEP